jgi:DNA-binding transcriptional ArsR family regulator
MAYGNLTIIALADPTRLAVFELVIARPRSVAEITRSLPVSQSAVSQHLKVLRGANLVRVETLGTRNIYHLDPAGLRRMRTWLDGMWEASLAAFAEEIHKTEIVSRKEKCDDNQC